MTPTRPALKLTHEAVLAVLAAAVAKAEAMRVPQCVAVVDEGTNLLGLVRMDGGRIPSMESAQRKARTAAATGAPTGGLPADNELRLVLGTGNGLTNLQGGLPIVVDGHVVGAIGVGSGTGEQDVAVAAAGLAAVPGARSF